MERVICQMDGSIMQIARSKSEMEGPIHQIWMFIYQTVQQIVKIRGHIY